MLRPFFTCLLVPVCLAVASTGTLAGAAPLPPLVAAQNDGGPAAPRPIALDVPFAATQLRKALELPHSEAQFGFNADYSPVVGTTWRWQFDPAPEPRAEIARLIATLKSTNEDADIWLHIGYFRKEAGDTPGALEAYGKAETLFRAQMTQHPQDAAPLVGLSAALGGLNRSEAGETVLRDAIKLAPNDPRALTALAGIVTSRVSTPLFSELTRAAELSRNVGRNAPESAPGRADQNALDESLGRLLAMATPAQLQIAESRLQQAKTLNDLAVALAPQQPAVYLERAGTAYSRFSITQSLQTLSNAPQQLKAQTTPEARQGATATLLSNAYSTFMVGIMNPDSQTDLERAAQFSVPEEAARLRSMAAFIGTIRAKFIQNPTPEQLAAIRATIDTNANEIERLAQAAQPPSARLWSFLGLVRMVQTQFQDDATNDGGEAAQTAVLTKAADDAARRALELDEHQSIAWDVRMIVTDKSDDGLKEMQQLAVRRLALDPSASNQFILARNLALQDKDQDALRQTETGLKNSPNDWALRLLRATLLLRQPDEASLTAAVPLVSELGHAPQASGSDAELLNTLNGVMLARLHRFSEAELVLASDRTDAEGPTPIAYSALMADIEQLALTLATAKRHEDVLSLARIMARLPLFTKRDDLIKLGITPAELVGLAAQ